MQSGGETRGMGSNFRGRLHKFLDHATPRLRLECLRHSLAMSVTFSLSDFFNVWAYVGQHNIAYYVMSSARACQHLAEPM